VRYPAVASSLKEGWTLSFRDFPELILTGAKPNLLLPRATQALTRKLSECLINGELPPQPSKRFRLLRNQRLVPIPVELTLSLQILLRWARADAGLTQAQLGERTGFSQPQIARIERPGAHPKLESIAKLAAAMGLVVEAVLSRRG
jgi:DNA-binding XRE family transcriptional regulator